MHAGQARFVGQHGGVASVGPAKDQQRDCEERNNQRVGSIRRDEEQTEGGIDA